ncbi:DUF6343 family protein [Micromonospora endophytica]|uniref:Uncharacterized protein n=1 Tax=Micromonospora endophytica TaxID=515350 RepID=A0A2W2C7Y8_9ACTN|nr:DUF6343 family protein [Micromonospora endophytica]PZF88018.1 hypothetical protein C1I93_25480 [Micromonospora endophytica]RIW46426.1 hypothetical protein D3H59_12395 [Micromonospora endophytica]BCJ57400.1 hypothetical protein Jiend_08220 [Micromonospora endophytica]
MTRSQPRRARGTVGHANSALNLRLALASFGLVSMTVFAVLAFRADVIWLGVACVVLAVVAVVDLAVIQRRRAARRREEPGVRHSLFE